MLMTTYLLQVHREQLLSEGALYSVEERRLLLRINSVDATERKTKETIVVGVLCELI